MQLEREGFLDDPEYIEGLPKDHSFRRRENVYPFALACGSQQLLQLLACTVAPEGFSNPGAQIHHFVGGFMEPPILGGCEATCAFPSFVGMGDDVGLPILGLRPGNVAPEVKSIQKPGFVSRFARAICGWIADRGHEQRRRP